MSDKLKGLPRFWKEVKRRNVLRSLAIYAGTAFIILEASTIVFPRWGLPDWSIDLVLYLLILGVLINNIVAWIFDFTPQGMQKTKALEARFQIGDFVNFAAEFRKYAYGDTGITQTDDIKAIGRNFGLTCCHCVILELFAENGQQGPVLAQFCHGSLRILLGYETHTSSEHGH